jgi:hypothetical protein
MSIAIWFFCPGIFPQETGKITTKLKKLKIPAQNINLFNLEIKKINFLRCIN